MKIDINEIKSYIYSSCEAEVKKIISKYNDNLDKINNEIVELEKKLAISEAKIYTYEKIIASSNFKPIITPPLPYVIQTNFEEGESNE